MKPADIFTSKENIVGYVETDSGTLLITDGIWDDRIKVSARNKVYVDLGMDRVRIPVIATKQNGRKFLLIPLDQAEVVIEDAGDIVGVEGKADVPIMEKSDDE